MKMVLVSLLVVSILVVGMTSSPTYAESISKKYYTQPYWIYQIEIEYSGDKQFYVFWDGKRVNAIIPNERLGTSEIEVYATSNETILQIYDTGDVNNLSANVRILDLAEIGPLSSKEIKNIKSQSIEDPKDRRILELEARVQILENEKFNLEKEVTRLNGIVDTVQNELKKMTDEFFITIQNQFNWFQSKIGN
jgi:uncharacterized coiled-coil protein SlyX